MAVVDCKFYVFYGVTILHICGSAPGLYPDTTHFRLHFAHTVRPNAAARSVAHGLRAVHGTGHARFRQNAIAAHLAIK